MIMDEKLRDMAININFSYGANEPLDMRFDFMKKLLSADNSTYTDEEMVEALVETSRTY